MIKKTILLSFFLCCIFGFSQKYEFDYLIEYQTKIGKNVNYPYCLAVSSQNKSVIMEIGKNSITNKYYAILLDYERNIGCHFLINGKTITNNTKFELERKYEFQSKSFFRYNYINVEEMEDSQLRISALNKKKKKEKVVFEMEISLMKFPKDLSFIFYEPLTNEQEMTLIDHIKQKLTNKPDFSEGFVIKNLTIKSNSLQPYMRTLKNINKTNLVINLD